MSFMKSNPVAYIYCNKSTTSIRPTVTTPNPVTSVNEGERPPFQAAHQEWTVNCLKALVPLHFHHALNTSASSVTEKTFLT